MKPIPRLFPLCLLAASVARADLIIDNMNPSTGSAVTTGSQATFRWQSFTPSVAGVGPTDNITASSPLPGTVFLNSAEFLRAPSGNAAAGLIFVDVHEYNSATDTLGTYIGSSSNSVDVNNQAFDSLLTWTFPTLSLQSSTEYALAFSSDGVAGNVFGAGNGARISAANFGGGFVNTYNGGEAVGSVGPVVFDARFRVIADVVPEPSTAGLLALGGLLLRRRFRAEG